MFNILLVNSTKKVFNNIVYRSAGSAGVYENVFIRLNVIGKESNILVKGAVKEK